MIETQWIHIEKRFDITDITFKKYYVYTTFDDIVGEAIAYKIKTNSNEYSKFINFLVSNGIRFNIFRREYKFSKKEGEDSEILHLNICSDAKESYSPDHEGYVCEQCKEQVQFLQINNLQVKYLNIKKYDLSITYMGDTEIIISEKLKDIFIREGVTGIQFSNIFDLDSNDIIEGFYHLRLQEGIGDVVEPSIVEKDVKCNSCGFYHTFLCQTPLYFLKDSWKGLDICFTSNWFGQPPSYQGKNIIISKRLYQILIKNNIKRIEVQPSFLI
ncbi:hypothetical protein AN960_09880 [Bacillus sp. FJAT-25509]|uniref:hypothetical protein n=1 Tax=Bacillus sp. FJAT-25509 TaxID=1712029 RepID=UPI0006F3653A|nr:hypothetical protein [Bacillus sp. FJAT-25509]KQL39264.1 hypothetical protein AN960_09880 [Bacillus sp. FJAT-25509]